MHAWIEEEKWEIVSRYPDSPRYGLEPDPRAYPRAVAQELHTPPWRSVLPRST